MGPESMHTLVLSLVDTLADLHALDPAAIGLADKLCSHAAVESVVFPVPVQP